jgi:hypothetical protein
LWSVANREKKDIVPTRTNAARGKKKTKKENQKGTNKKKRHRRFQAVTPTHLQEIQIREM